MTLKRSGLKSMTKGLSIGSIVILVALKGRTVFSFVVVKFSGKSAVLMGVFSS